MNKQFYLQHSLVTMCDPRMRNLLVKEGLKGIGAYWVILEKLELLPEPCAQLEYLRPFCKSLGISFAYIKKIILEYQLFSMDEEGYFEPQELNPIHQKEQKSVKSESKSINLKLKNEVKNEKKAQKTVENTSKNDDFELKNDEKQQKIAEKTAENAEKITKNAPEKQAKIEDNYLKNSVLAEFKAKSLRRYIKENREDRIIIITTTEKEKEKETAAAAAAVSVPAAAVSVPAASGAVVPVAVWLKLKTCGKRKPQISFCLLDASGNSGHFSPPQCVMPSSKHPGRLLGKDGGAFAMTHVAVPNDAAQLPKPRSSMPVSCVIWVT